MRLRTLLALLAVVASAAFGLAACGGDGDDSTASPAESGTTTGMADDMDMAAVAVTSPAAAALDANSMEVADAIGSVYGDEAAKQFLDGPSLWRDHIGFFVDYTVALAKGDEAGQQEAVDNLTGYTGAFSGFLAEATGLPQPALQDGLAMHIGHLKGQIDAYA